MATLWLLRSLLFGSEHRRTCCSHREHRRPTNDVLCSIQLQIGPASVGHTNSETESADVFQTWLTSTDHEWFIVSRKCSQRAWIGGTNACIRCIWLHCCTCHHYQNISILTLLLFMCLHLIDLDRSTIFLVFVIKLEPVLSPGVPCLTRTKCLASARL